MKHEMIMLSQRDMIIFKFDVRFSYLLQYSSELVLTKDLYYTMFMNNINDYLLMLLLSQLIATYHVLLEEVNTLEQNENLTKAPKGKGKRKEMAMLLTITIPPK